MGVYACLMVLISEANQLVIQMIGATSKMITLSVFTNIFVNTCELVVRIGKGTQVCVFVNEHSFFTSSRYSNIDKDKGRMERG